MTGMAKHAGFDFARVVRVRISVDKAAGTFQFGSGYLVAPEFVFTAGHVLSLVEGATPVAGAECEVEPLGTKNESWQPGEVVWTAGSEHDVALIKVAHLGVSVPPARFGQLEGFQPVKWRAIGFPVASIDDSGRKEEDAWGEVSPVTGQSTGQLGLTVQSRQARPTVAGGSGWAGLSGAAVFSGDALVGLVIKDPAAYENSLVGTRIETIANDAALRQLLGDALLVEIDFRHRQLSPPPTVRWASRIIWKGLWRPWCSTRRPAVFPQNARAEPLDHRGSRRVRQERSACKPPRQPSI